MGPHVTLDALCYLESIFFGKIMYIKSHPVATQEVDKVSNVGLSGTYEDSG